MKCSMIAPRIIGSSSRHSPALLVTVIESEPKNTPLIPAMPNSIGQQRLPRLFGVAQDEG